MTGGRLVLGLGIGGRDDDHQVTGIDNRTRGRRLDEQMAAMHREDSVRGNLAGIAIQNGRSHVCPSELCEMKGKIMSLFSHLAPAKRHSKGKKTTTTSTGRTSHHRKHRRRTSSTGTHK
ncbi:hypothetical protein ACIBM1_48080 [Streptomyces sp. NPDC050481]|uniref:hypothetical protein n=1 Tax=Streptomyces sp. NPDC050481 TaxID=3365616 RepID=UPI0037BE13B4